MPEPANKAIKVLQIITRLNVGGPAQHAVSVAANLNKGSFKSKVIAGITDKHEGDMSFVTETHGVSLVPVENLRNEAGIAGDLVAFWQIYRILKKEKPDLVNLHLLKARFFGGMAARLARIPVIVETFHGNLFEGYYGKLTTSAILWVERFLGWSIMNRVIAISERQKEELVRYRICPPRKIQVIPLGLSLSRFLDCSTFRGQLREELGISEKTMLIGIVGRLVPIKGLSYLLEAIHKVARVTEKELRLLVIGDGPMREQLESQVSALGLGGKVRFLGWRFDLEKLYADLDIVVLSSLNEGTPFSLIEAMSAGKAVVATSVGGVPDVVEDGRGGLLVPPKNPAAMADAILRLINDVNLRNCLGQQAKYDVYPRYDVSRLTRDMHSYYLGLAGVSDADK